MLGKVSKLIVKVNKSVYIPEIFAVVLLWFIHIYSSGEFKILSFAGDKVKVMGNIVPLDVIPEEAPLAMGVMLMTVLSAIMIYILADVPYKMQVERQSRKRNID